MRCTTYVAVDREHLPELRLSLETWRKHRPEIWRGPLVLIVDGDLDLSFVEHPDMQVVPPVAGDYANQREKMLTSLTVLPATATTPWYLKLDTDAVALRSGSWFDEGWFSGDFCLVSSPWGYTKPAYFLDQLDVWAQGVPELASEGRPPRVYAGGVAKSKRIISYVMFGRTDWTEMVVGLLDGPKLPCPSQDTFLWYCAARMKDPFLRVKMSNFGWAHGGSSYRRVRELCQFA